MFQEQPVSDPAAEGDHQPHRGVLPGPARLQVHPAEAGARLRRREAARVPGDSLRRLQPNDRCFWQLRHTEVFRIWNY